MMKAHTFAHLKAHRSGFVAVFVSVFCAALLTCGLGVLLESGVRGGVSPHLYAGADAIVSAPQALEVKEDADQPFAGEENSLGKGLIGVFLDLERLWRTHDGVGTGVEMW